jgi:hypothetical protein
MDMWKFYDITHREHVVCNPTSEEKLARLVDGSRQTRKWWTLLAERASS